MCAILIDLLDRPPASPVEIERAHRALRPRPRDTEPARDIICCLVNFPLKEDIMRRARERGLIQFNETEVTLFQDLSQLTL